MAAYPRRQAGYVPPRPIEDGAGRDDSVSGDAKCRRTTSKGRLTFSDGFTWEFTDSHLS